MVCKYYLTVAFEIRGKIRKFLARFLPQFHRGTCHFFTRASELFTFSFTMRRQQTLFSFLSVRNGKKSRMEKVSGKVILDVTSIRFASNVGKSVPWTSHLTIGFRKLVLLHVNWPTFTCGDRKLHLRHEMLHIQVKSV